MSETESRLADFWAATDAPAHDLAFVLAVEERIARRRMLIDVAGRVSAGLVVAAGLVVFAPMIIPSADAFAGSLDAAGPALAAVAALGAMLVRLDRAPGDPVFGDLEEAGESLA